MPIRKKICFYDIANVRFNSLVLYTVPFLIHYVIQYIYVKGMKYATYHVSQYKALLRTCVVCYAFCVRRIFIRVFNLTYTRVFYNLHSRYILRSITCYMLSLFTPLQLLLFYYGVGENIISFARMIKLILPQHAGSGSF
jgi:hypothetical protein